MVNTCRVVNQEEAEDAIQSKCKHVFCRQDVIQYIQSAPSQTLDEDALDLAGAAIGFRSNGRGKQRTDKSVLCPVCFKELSIDLSQPSVSEADVFGKSSSDVKKNTSIVNRLDLTTWRSSTKIEGFPSPVSNTVIALVQELRSLQRESVTLKSIVFSQFVSFLDLIQWYLLIPLIAKSGVSPEKASTWSSLTAAWGRKREIL